MSERLTSVIIPAYNSEETLAVAVRSALNQEPPPFEIIVIDDGSSDGTELVAHTFKSDIKYISQANAGPAAARNTGLRAARGQFVAFLDVDDYWLPGFLHTCQHFLTQHSQAVAVSVGQRFIKINGAEFSLPSFQGEEHPFLIDDFFDFWATHDHIRTGSCMIRRSTIQAAGLQLENLRISEDLEYWAYLATFGRWGFVPTIFWVCDSERAGARTGWLRKYSVRRALCPTVEDWQQRILPRLSDKDMPGFLKQRGKVAANLAHTQILAGHCWRARNIVRKYGADMPSHWSSRLMRLGDKTTLFGWGVACSIIKAREFQKVGCLALPQLVSRLLRSLRLLGTSLPPTAMICQ